MRVIRLLLLVLLLIGTSFIATIATAQPDEKWYYGWNPDAGQLFSYTADGENHLLIETGIQEVHTVRRINVTDAVGVFTVNGEAARRVYLLSPEEARLLVPSFDPQSLAEGAPEYVPQDFTDDYGVFASSGSPLGAVGFRADFNAGTLDLLDERRIEVYFGPPRFSEDGQLLRYITFDSDANDAWSLREIDLTTGEERTIYTDTGFPALVGDDFGDHWITSITDQANSERRFLLLDASGNSEIVAETPSTNPSIVRIVDDSIGQFNANCTEDCLVTVTPISGGNAREFIAPATFATFSPLAFPDPEHLLILNNEGDSFYLLSESGQPTLIGAYSPLIAGQPPSEMLSPDGRYLLVFIRSDGGPVTGYGVWDFVEQQFVIQNPPDEAPIFLIYFSDSGFLVSQGGQKTFLYRYTDQSTIELPAEAGFCFDALSDGDVLCSIGDENAALAAGIYRYSPDDDTYTLLVQDGTRLMR